MLFSGSVMTVAQEQIFLPDATGFECKTEECQGGKFEAGTWSIPDSSVYTRDKQKIVTEGKRSKVRYKLMIRNGVGLVDLFTVLSSELEETESSENFNVQLGGFLDKGKRLSLAGSFYFRHFKSRNFLRDGDQLSFMAYGFNAKVGCHWHRWSSGSLYSGGGLGAVKSDFSYSLGKKALYFFEFNFREESDYSVGFQFDILGVQYAPFKHLGLFAELGVGYEGLLQVGYQLHW